MVKIRYAAILLLTFLSATVSAEGFKFITMSDSRGPYNGVNDSVLTKIVNHILKTQKGVKFLIFAGDMVNGHENNPELTFNELMHWKEVMKPVYESPDFVWPKIWPVVGNHEIRHRKDEDNFRKAFPDVFANGPDDERGLSYSFDFGNSHFIIVNTDRWYYGDPDDTTDDRRDWHYVKHLDWLEKELSAAKKRGAKHIFVFSHEMAFPTGGHLRDGLPNLTRNLVLPLDSTRIWYLERRNKFWELLKKYNVDAHICGHEHLYARQSVDGVYEIITGSSGAPLYEFNPRYRENPDTVYPGEEMSYGKAVKYYQVLKYNYGPGKNSQASENFFGLKAFNYTVYDVQDDYVLVETYGGFLKEGTHNILGTEIKLIDKFYINKN